LVTIFIRYQNFIDFAKDKNVQQIYTTYNLITARNMNKLNFEKYK